jgi:hypothetical protein
MDTTLSGLFNRPIDACHTTTSVYVTNVSSRRQSFTTCRGLFYFILFEEFGSKTL